MKAVSRVLAGLLLGACVSSVSAQYYMPQMPRGMQQGMPMHAMPQQAMPQRQAAAAQNGAAQALQQGMDQLLAFLNTSARGDQAQLAAYLETRVAPMFDFAYMARWVAGRHFDALNPQQREQLAGALKMRLLQAMSSRLSGFDQQQVRVMPPRKVSDKEVKVGVMISNQGPYPAQVEFRLYKAGNSWKIFDISANGSSILAHYRRVFSRSGNLG